MQLFVAIWWQRVSFSSGDFRIWVVVQDSGWECDWISKRYIEDMCGPEMKWNVQERVFCYHKRFNGPVIDDGRIDNQTVIEDERTSFN